MPLQYLAIGLAFVAVMLALVVWRIVAARKAARPPRATNPRKAPTARKQAAPPPIAAPQEAEAQPPAQRRRQLKTAGEIAADEGNPAPITEAASPFLTEIVDNLDRHFTTYNNRQISLARYAALVQAEQQAVERHVTELRASPDPNAEAAIADVEAAREAVNWCLRWASEMVQEERRAARG